MHVPYSMDDSEPDLYGGMGGYSSFEDTQTKWDCEDRSDSYSHSTSYTPVIAKTVNEKLVFTQEDMNKVIQSHIKQIDGYRNEILELQWRLDSLEK